MTDDRDLDELVRRALAAGAAGDQDERLNAVWALLQGWPWRTKPTS